jgi:hypothetical protein
MFLYYVFLLCTSYSQHIIVGLAVWYNNMERQLRGLVRKLMALAFLPVVDIIPTFNYIIEYMMPQDHMNEIDIGNMQQFINYFTTIRICMVVMHTHWSYGMYLTKV